MNITRHGTLSDWAAGQHQCPAAAFFPGPGRDQAFSGEPSSLALWPWHAGNAAPTALQPGEELAGGLLRTEQGAGCVPELRPGQACPQIWPSMAWLDALMGRGLGAWMMNEASLNAHRGWLGSVP